MPYIVHGKDGHHRYNISIMKWDYVYLRAKYHVQTASILPRPSSEPRIIVFCVTYFGQQPSNYKHANLLVLLLHSSESHRLRVVISPSCHHKLRCIDGLFR